MINTVKYLPSLQINWEDFDAISVLADAEEEAGVPKASEILRWVVKEKKKPSTSIVEVFKDNCPPSIQCRLSSNTNNIVGYDWNRLPKLGETSDTRYSTLHVNVGETKESIIPISIFQKLPYLNWVNYFHYNLDRITWKSFETLDQAYTELVKAYLNASLEEERKIDNCINTNIKYIVENRSFSNLTKEGQIWLAGNRSLQPYGLCSCCLKKPCGTSYYYWVKTEKRLNIAGVPSWVFNLLKSYIYVEEYPLYAIYPSEESAWKSLIKALSCIDILS